MKSEISLEDSAVVTMWAIELDLGMMTLDVLAEVLLGVFDLRTVRTCVRRVQVLPFDMSLHVVEDSSHDFSTLGALVHLLA